MMLHYELIEPERWVEGAPLVVLLHGRGASEADLRPLRAQLPAEWPVVLPRAPFSGAEWGYGPGYAWYRFLGGDRPEPESFRAAQRALDTLLDALPARLPARPGALVLGGFSQGGTTSLGYALRHPREAPLVLNFSGFLPDHPDAPVNVESASGLWAFWGHGSFDEMIPIQLARRGRDRLVEAGAKLEARDYPIGHWIDPGEFRDARKWLEGQLDRLGGGRAAEAG